MVYLSFEFYELDFQQLKVVLDEVVQLKFFRGLQGGLGDKSKRRLWSLAPFGKFVNMHFLTVQVLKPKKSSLSC